MYADDTLLTSRARTLAESVTDCQRKLDKIMQWCEKNRLTLNIKKTKCMFINPLNEPSSANDCLHINNSKFDIVKHFEYLGMNLDEKLSLNKHVHSMIKKAKCKLGILYKIRKFISCQTSLLIYKVMIRPHMEYGDFIVESSSKSHIDKLERLQEKSLRLAEYQSPGKKKDISILKSNFGIENLSIRRKQSLLRLMYSQSKKVENLDTINQNMILGSDKKIKRKLDFTRLTKIQRSPYYRGLDLLNSLPDCIQKEPNRVKFRNMVKEFIT